jgi:hypothetical protein
VRGAMLDRSGRPTADRDFLVSPLLSFSTFLRSKLAARSHLALASDGDAYLAAHSQYVSWGRSRTHFTRITATGEVEPGIGSIDGTVRAMVFAGGYYFVATVPSEPQWRATLAVVDGHGRVLREHLTPVHPTDDEALDLALLATSDGKLLIAWEPWRQDVVGLALVSPADVLQSGFGGARRTAQVDGARLSPFAFAEGRDGFLLASINRSTDRAVLILALLGHDGALRQREDVRNAAEHSGIRQLAMMQTGPGFGILADAVPLTGYSDTAMLRVTASGERAGGFRLFDYAVPTSMAVVTGPDGTAFWGRIAFDRAEVVPVAPPTYSAPVYGGDHALLSRSHPAQDASAAARCGDTSIVAWRDRWTGQAVARLRRFAANGQPLDPPNRTLGRFPTINDWKPELTIVCGKTTAILAWREPWDERFTNDANVRGALLRANGSLVDLGVMTRSKLFRITFDGSSYVLLSNGDRSSWQRWTEQGVRASVALMPELDHKSITDLELAWNGSGLMAVWLEDVFRERGRLTHVRAREFRPNFQPNGPELSIAPEGEFDLPQFLALGSRPGQWLASWLELRDGPDWRVHSSPVYGPSVASFDSVTPLQLSWNGSAWELLDRYGVGLLDQNGRALGYHRLRDRGEVEAMTTSGGQRLYTFVHADPGEPSLVFAEWVAEEELRTSHRRRTMR